MSSIHWNPDPEIINVFGISVRYYGLLFLTGLFLSYYKLGRLFKHQNFKDEALQQFLMFGVVGILAGARLGHCLFYQPDYYLAHPLEIILPFRLEGGFEFTGYQGLASHGGVLGLLIAIIIYSRKNKISSMTLIDMTAIVAGIGAGFIRLANLMNSEIIGKATNASWGFVFERIDNVPRHPAQLYEAICYFIVLAVMNYFYKRNSKSLGTGFFFGLLIFLIFTIRFIIEFIKENQVGFEDALALNMGQILSIPYILLGAGFIIYSRFKLRKALV